MPYQKASYCAAIFKSLKLQCISFAKLQTNVPPKSPHIAAILAALYLIINKFTLMSYQKALYSAAIFKSV